MFKIFHQITIGSDQYKSPSNSRLTWLEHSSHLDSLVNVCSLKMAPPDGLTIDPDDDIQVELGNGSGSGVIFTGKVTEADWRIKEIRIEATTSSRLLTLAWYNMYFEQSTAGQIVSSICSEASVATGQVDDGLTFDYYAIDSNRNAADHIRTLALLCGFDVYPDENDKLIFTPPATGNPFILQYAVNIISASIQLPAEGYGATEIYGESPASFGQGSSAATWFTKTEVNGAASSGNGFTLPFFDPSLRTVDQTNLAAQRYLDFYKPKKTGKVIIPGNPDIKTGNAVSIEDMPVSSQNGSYKVTGTEHLFSSLKGYLTRLMIEEI